MMNPIAAGNYMAGTPAAEASRGADADPAKVRDAAEQFEALLMGQILRSMRESGNGWMGSGGDPSGDCATDFAEQQLAAALAQRGGLGLSKLISEGLKK